MSNTDFNEARNRLDTLYGQLRESHFKPVYDDLNKQLEETKSRLCREMDTTEVFRLQGAARVLEHLLDRINIRYTNRA